MNALLIGALARARLAAKPVRKSAWSDDHRNPHTYAPHDAMTREGVRALATEGFLLQLSNWREEKTDAGLYLLADMGLWHGLSGTWWPMTPWREPLEGGADRGKAWHAAQVAARAYAHREVCSLEVLDESRAAGPAPAPVAPVTAPGDGLSQEDRDAFARAVGAPTEEEERELRKAETEAQLRAASTPQNGTAPHIDPDPTLAPVKRGELIAFDAKTGKAPVTCPVCKGPSPVSVAVVCQGCRRSVCLACSTTDDENPEGSTTCTDCDTAESNADVAPPFLFDEATEKARVLLARDDHSLVEVCKAVGVDYLGEGPLGCLLGYDGCRFRLAAVDLERWLRGDLTVGIDEDEDQEDEAGAVSPPAEPSPAPGTSPGAVSPPGDEASGTVPETGGCKAAASEPTPSTDGGSSKAGAGVEAAPSAPAPGTYTVSRAGSNITLLLPSPGSVAAKAGVEPRDVVIVDAAKQNREVDAYLASRNPNPEPSPSSSLPEATGPAASSPEVPAAQSPAEASGGGAPTHCTVHTHDTEASLRGKAVTLIRPGEPGEPAGGNWNDGGPWCHPCTEGRRAGAPLYTTPFALDDTVPRGRYAVRLRGSSSAWAAAATLREAGELRRTACERGYGPSGVWVEDREDPVADDGGGRDLTAEAEVACRAKPSDEPPLLQPGPALLSAVDAVLSKDGVGPVDPVAERKALGALWLDTKRHQATKKAPDGFCLLCDQAFARGEFYRVGKKALGKGFSHDSCVARLAEGKDPKVNERHQLEREAIDRLTPAATEGATA